MEEVEGVEPPTSWFKANCSAIKSTPLYGRSCGSCTHALPFSTVCSAPPRVVHNPSESNYKPTLSVSHSLIQSTISEPSEDRTQLTTVNSRLLSPDELRVHSMNLSMAIQLFFIWKWITNPCLLGRNISLLTDMVDPTRIELVISACKAEVIPFNYRPIRNCLSSCVNLIPHLGCCVKDFIKSQKHSTMVSW